MTIDGGDGGSRRSFGTLLRDLAEDGTTFVRDEFRLARIELGRAATGIGQGTVCVATAAVCAMLGVLSLITGFVLLIGDQWLPRDLYWVAALLVLVVAGALAALLARRGLALLRPAELVPHETVTTLKEDGQWVNQLKRRPTSARTSS